MSEHKMVTIEGRQYRIGRLTAFTGSRILNVLMSAMSKVENKPDERKSAEFEEFTAEEKANGAIQAMWVLGGTSLAADKYDDIQRSCLACCAMYPSENSDPIPLLMANGKWTDATLEYDITSVSQLVLSVLQFNLAPLFTERASNSAGSALAPTNPQPSSTATASRFDQ